MPVFGFGEQKARTLSRLAESASLRPKNKAGFRYAQVLPQFGGADVIRGIADQAIALDATGTVRRLIDDTEVESGDEDQVKTEMGAIPSGAKVYYVLIGETYFAISANVCA